VWHGAVARIAPSADERLRTFALYVEVLNPTQAVPLMPGMFVRAQIDGPTLRDVLLVPRGAVRQDQVFVCRGGRAQACRVAVEQTLLERCVIGGLAPGEVVITSNLDVLYDGAPVAPIVAATGTGSDPALTASAGSSAPERESCQTP
jgi:multidrug efflux pump subunit AcrA (membrane-fusion protein)